MVSGVGALGELREIEGADWDLEIGGIADLVTERWDSPAILFDDIIGYPRGSRGARLITVFVSCRCFSEVEIESKKI
jgi:hypothetical protein